MPLTIIPEKFTKQSECLYKDTREKIDILQEECAELIQVGSKIKREGIANVNTSKNPTRDHLIMEIAHVLMTTESVAASFGITKGDIIGECIKKADKHGFDTTAYKPKTLSGVERIYLFMECYPFVQVLTDRGSMTKNDLCEVTFTAYDNNLKLLEHTVADIQSVDVACNQFIDIMISAFNLNKSKYDQVLKEAEGKQV